jgi:aldose sugar dehydrogenase
MYSLASQVSASRILSVNLVIICIVSLTGYHSVASYAQESMPVLNDPELHVELITEELIDPTTMAFTGPGDVLVLEKSSGAVQRIVNGQMLPEPILDVNVNEKDERGLLGIAVSKNLPDNKTYVFLYYTEAEEDGGDPVGNRLYRYELVDNKLINPKLLLDLPYLPGPAHNGGTVKIGPDNIVYITIGELIETKYNGNDYNTLAQNYPNGKQPDGRGGILRVTQDGQIINGKGILGDNHPLNIYYAYGIRNSFGIDFDPVTGNLWETENGGHDEINLVEPGFNSGWPEVSGMSFLNDDFDEEDLVDFGGRGKYSDPELDLGSHVAPTGITFIHSDSLGERYEDQMFVATTDGRIFNFQLDEDRTGLVLTGSIEDKISDDMDDLDNVVFAELFELITDLEVGPDGYLYGTTYNENGTVFRVLPAIAISGDNELGPLM